MRIIFLLFTILFITSSCNKKIKEKVGISTSGPNEYQVERNKGLEIPPHYDLPKPSTSYNYNSNNAPLQNLNDGEQALMQEIH